MERAVSDGSSGVIFQNVIQVLSGPTIPQPAPQRPEGDNSPDQLDESTEARIERLGRQRPSIFSSAFKEIAFVFSITMSQIITEFFVSGFTVILPSLIVDLGIPQASSVWPASAFSLVIASTLLFWGRLGDMFGGYPIYLFGLTWLVVFSVIAGFSINPLMLDFCRALQGVGAAAFLPSGTMLMGKAYRPGPRKNLVFALYGTCAVIGFFVGIFVAGMVGQFISWSWYFWIGSILAAVTLAASVFAIPHDCRKKQDAGVKMDWLGAGTIVGGLVLVVFALTEASHAPDGWRTPYIPTLLIVGVISLGIAIYIESSIVSQPLLPPTIFKIKSMTALIFSLLLLYGTVGIYLLYGTLYFENFMHASPLQVVAWYTPTVLGGLFISTAEGFVLHLVPGRILLILASCGAIGAQLLLALVPKGGAELYWPWILPAMILCTVGIDMAVNVMAIYITTQLPSAQQGLAGGLINSILQLGLAFILAFADIVQSNFEPRVGLRKSYKATFWLGVGVGSLSLVLVAVWGGIPKAKSDLTADERRELELEAVQSRTLEGTPAISKMESK